VRMSVPHRARWRRRAERRCRCSRPRSMACPCSDTSTLLFRDGTERH
jgi:hypothetical protein